METDLLDTTDPEEPQKPFVIENRRQETTADRSFQPSAAVFLTPSLRTSGLLHALPGDDLKNLLLVLTFVHPNGWCQPTIFELSHAMQVSQSKARRQLGRLTAFPWQGKPLLTELCRDSGMDAYAPSPLIVGHRVSPVTDTVTAEPVLQAAGRDAVIAYSRAQYARPRTEVEREMAILNGWPLPEEMGAQIVDKPAIEEDAEHAEARQRLLGLNVSHEEIDRLLSTYPIESILQQLLWLPSRNAKSKARLIVAAIEGNYDAPGTPRFRP